MDDKSTKVQWRRLQRLVPRVIALGFMAHIGMDWLANAIPAHAGLAHDVAGLLFLALLVVLVLVPALDACGIRVDRSERSDAKAAFRICGFGLLAVLLVGVNRLRYFLEIDETSLYNTLFNILISVLGAGGYGLLRYLERRRTALPEDRPDQ